MTIYDKMLKHFVFSIEDVNQYYHNINSARSAIARLLTTNKALKIRRNLYTCISLETGGPVANRFQIASSINKCSCVSHHTALEYYGISDQIYYDVYVSSAKRFPDFEFDGYIYHFIRSRIDVGIISPEFSGEIKITDKERTFLDCLKDMDKYSGIEETIENIRGFKNFDEDKLLRYLELYDNQFLYQKTGFILSCFQKSSGISDEFIDSCHERIGKSKRYLTNTQKKGVYNEQWNLIIPDNYLILKNGGITDAAI